MANIKNIVLSRLDDQNTSVAAELFPELVTRTVLVGRLSSEANSALDESLVSTATSEFVSSLFSVHILAIALFPGIVANAITMYTFIRLGLADSVVIGFFALAISDMLCLMVALYSWLCNTLEFFSKDWSVDMGALFFLGVWYFQMSFDISMLTTTFTAVQKCSCVALPFQFRSVFTRTRTVIVITIIWFFCIGLCAPVLFSQGLQNKVLSDSNSSKYVIWFSEHRPALIAANDLINRVILQNVSEVIAIACTLILSKCLVNQLKFRHQASHPHVSGDLRPSSRSCAAVSPESDNTKEKSDGSLISTRISSKELQVIKSVTLVSVIFILGNCPRIALSAARLIVPELDAFRRYQNIHYILHSLRRIIEVSSAGLNFLIYYNFNSRFRETVLSSFRCCYRV